MDEFPFLSDSFHRLVVVLVCLLIFNRRKIHAQRLPTVELEFPWHHSLLSTDGGQVDLHRSQPSFLSPRYLFHPPMHIRLYSESSVSLPWPIRPYSKIWSPAPHLPTSLTTFPLAHCCSHSGLLLSLLSGMVVPSQHLRPSYYLLPRKLFSWMVP